VAGFEDDGEDENENEALTIMAKVIFGNHTAVFAARSEQARIRKFYCDVLGCKVRVKTDEVDRFQLADLHFCFVYQSTARDENNFLKAIHLELKTDNTEEMKQKILAFGVKKLELPDPHLLFPGSRWPGFSTRGYQRRPLSV
jgi:hypothetical protein